MEIIRELQQFTPETRVHVRKSTIDIICTQTHQPRGFILRIIACSTSHHHWRGLVIPFPRRRIHPQPTSRWGTLPLTLVCVLLLTVFSKGLWRQRVSAPWDFPPSS